jgi:DNA repair protein RadD
VSKVWSVFGQDELQAFIGPEQLRRLEAMLPVLSDNDGTVDDLYRKETLCAIFDAFVGPDAMQRPEFRSDFYNHLPVDTVGQLCRAAGIEPSGSFRENISEISRRGWRDPTFCRQAAEVLGLSEEFLPVERDTVPSEQILLPPVRRLKPLKDYQFAVFHEASTRLEPNCSRFVIQMPTGSGKTRTAMELVAAILNEAPEGSVVVWLAHSGELCDQAYECFVETWAHLGGRPVRVARLWGASSTLPYASNESCFVIGGFQKLHRMLKGNEVPFEELRRRVHTVVVDEAHKVLAPTYVEVTRALLGDSTRVVGLTATPGRSIANDEENRALAEFFFNSIVAIPDGGGSVIGSLRKRGILSDATYEPLRTSTTITLTTSQIRGLAAYLDLPESVLVALAADDIRNLEIVRRLQKECQLGGHILFFACSVDHSRFVCANLVYLGIKAAHVDGETSAARRKHTIDAFRRGEIQVLCNFGVLSTGFDAPRVDVVFISRPTASIVLYSQMIGRGLRGPAIGGTASCKIIDVRDNIVGFPDADGMYEYFAEYFVGEGESRA